MGIETSEWKPSHEPLNYDFEFVVWVDSINRDFKKRIDYEPFKKYVSQAYQWLADTSAITDFRYREEQEEFLLREVQRCKDNSLYALNKRLYLKDGASDGGALKFKAWPAQEIALFIADCGYNLMLGKPRQIGGTSMFGGYAANKINVNRSMFVKFVTHNKDKGEEIFEDKIKYAFYNFENWFKQNVYNDSHNMLGLRKPAKKGTSGGANSRILVGTPTVDSINGGSPNITMVDEIGLMKIFGNMMREGRPTLFRYDPEKKRQEMIRQLIAWGTGGEMDKGGAVFEDEFKACLKAWNDRNFSYGIVPLFFNAFARPGITKKILEKEKKVYYSKDGPDKNFAKTQYHQHYPMSIEDMFLRNSPTIVPVADINKHILKIQQLKDQDQVQYGYYEPVFDRNRPAGMESDVPFQIVGAEFIPTKGHNDDRTTTIMFRKPERGWKWRYYAGTDPINSETGHSKMSQSIWDKYANTVSSVVNYRGVNMKDVYLQCLLQDIYYGTPGVPELVENNIGDWYIQYKEDKGYIKSIIPNRALHPTMQTPSSKWWGISNKANTAGKIANKLLELLDMYADNIYIPEFWIQLKTFVEKPLSGANTVRQTRFQAQDTRYDRDDVIFSVIFAFINAESHRQEPYHFTEEKKSDVVRKYVCNAETNFRQRLVEVDGNGKILRYVKGRR